MYTWYIACFTGLSGWYVHGTSCWCLRLKEGKSKKLFSVVALGVTLRIGSAGIKRVSKVHSNLPLNLIIWQACPMVQQGVSAPAVGWDTLTTGNWRPGGMVSGIHRRCGQMWVEAAADIVFQHEEQSQR